MGVLFELHRCGRGTARKGHGEFVGFGDCVVTFEYPGTIDEGEVLPGAVGAYGLGTEFAGCEFLGRGCALDAETRRDAVFVNC